MSIVVIDDLRQSFDVTPDGHAFPFTGSRNATTAAEAFWLVLVTHWFADLRAG